MPSSDIHLDESIVFHEPESLHLAIEMIGGGANFHSVHYIELIQTMCAVEAFIENREPVFPNCVDAVLSSDRNQWLPLFHITVNINYAHFANEIRENRNRGHEEMQKLFDQWSREKKSFREVLRNEIYSIKHVKINSLMEAFYQFENGKEAKDPKISLDSLLNPILSEYREIKNCAKSHGIPESELDAFPLSFWSSRQAQASPSHIMSSYIFAAIARRAANGMNRRKMTRGIINDVRAISTYAHYVDAMFIDRECAGLLQEGPLSSELRYKAKIFSFADTGAFLKYLDDIEIRAEKSTIEAARELYSVS